MYRCELKVKDDSRSKVLAQSYPFDIFARNRFWQPILAPLAFARWICWPHPRETESWIAAVRRLEIIYCAASWGSILTTSQSGAFEGGKKVFSRFHPFKNAANGQGTSFCFSDLVDRNTKCANATRTNPFHRHECCPQKSMKSNRAPSCRGWAASTKRSMWYPTVMLVFGLGVGSTSKRTPQIYGTLHWQTSCFM